MLASVNPLYFFIYPQYSPELCLTWFLLQRDMQATQSLGHITLRNRNKFFEKESLKFKEKDHYPAKRMKISKDFGSS